VGNPPLGDATADAATWPPTRAARKPGRLASRPDASPNAPWKTPMTKARMDPHFLVRTYGWNEL
jgi:hypothetical protein